MIITVGEALKEMESYPYSLECYELMKESMELKLEALYMEGREFYDESVEYGENISESVKVLFEDAKEPNKEGFFKKAWNSIVRILKILLKPFTLVYKAIDKFVNFAYDKIAEMIRVRCTAKDLDKLYMKDGKVDKEIGKKWIDEFKKNHADLYEKILKGNYAKAESMPRKVVKLLKKYYDEPEITFLSNAVDFIYGPNIKIPKIFIAMDGNNSLWSKDNDVSLHVIEKFLSIPLDEYEDISFDEMKLVWIGVKSALNFINSEINKYVDMANGDIEISKDEPLKTTDIIVKFSEFSKKIMPVTKKFVEDIYDLDTDGIHLMEITQKVVGVEYKINV